MSATLPAAVAAGALITTMFRISAIAIAITTALFNRVVLLIELAYHATIQSLAMLRAAVPAKFVGQRHLLCSVSLCFVIIFNTPYTITILEAVVWIYLSR